MKNPAVVKGGYSDAVRFNPSFLETGKPEVERSKLRLTPSPLSITRLIRAAGMKTRYSLSPNPPAVLGDIPTQ